LSFARNGNHQEPPWIEPTHLPADTVGMAKKPMPEPPTPIVWNIYKFASKAIWLGAVEAADEATAIERAAVEFRAPAKKLIATRQRL
jgi:hypothetical protein